MKGATKRTQPLPRSDDRGVPLHTRFLFLYVMISYSASLFPTSLRSSFSPSRTPAAALSLSQAVSRGEGRPRAIPLRGARVRPSTPLPVSLGFINRLDWSVESPSFPLLVSGSTVGKEGIRISVSALSSISSELRPSHFHVYALLFI